MEKEECCLRNRHSVNVPCFYLFPLFPPLTHPSAKTTGASTERISKGPGFAANSPAYCPAF
jgi:hypothetical protein